MLDVRKMLEVCCLKKSLIIQLRVAQVFEIRVKRRVYLQSSLKL
jgi:hypothetical protein